VELETVREVREATGDGASAQAALAALTDELDALQAAVKAAYPGELTCHRGCDSCCHQLVGVSRVEAARVAAAVAALPAEARAALVETATRAAALDRPRCGALDDGGGCQIYDGRPMVCRSHGLVYATPNLSRGRSLPVLQSSCRLNFNGALAEAPLVYDFAAWSERLLAVDDAFAEEVGLGADVTVARSIALADVLASLLLR
jgi:Fe-S-cluster containining protein